MAVDMDMEKSKMSVAVINDKDFIRFISIFEI